MLTDLQVRLLKMISPGAPPAWGDGSSAARSRLPLLLGTDFFDKVKDKVVVEFGCGEGMDAIEIARNGARRVIGLDIREEVLELARKNAQAAGLSDICSFSTTADEPADIVVSVDAFEHFGDPAGILRIMSGLLKPTGEVLVSFGPTWYHPLGGHLFSVFPWAHLLFSEKALIRWRATFRDDGATRFGEVAGGLNQMTIAKFEALIASSPFRVAYLDLIPIGKLRPLHNRWTREFTTAVVRCGLVERKATA